MDEIVPGILHWTAHRETIDQTVHSHLHVRSGAVFDPLFPPGAGPDALAQAALPSVVLLSNRHHLRDAPRVAEAFGCDIRVHETGLHEFDGEVGSFAYGEEVVDGVTALELGVLTPEDTVFHLEAGDGALLFADGLLHADGKLGLMPDDLLGDDPDAVRGGLLRRLAEIAERDDFDTLLFAHGAPIPNGGRDVLRAFANVG